MLLPFFVIAVDKITFRTDYQVVWEWVRKRPNIEYRISKIEFRKSNSGKNRGCPDFTDVRLRWAVDDEGIVSGFNFAS